MRSDLFRTRFLSEEGIPVWDHSSAPLPSPVRAAAEWQGSGGGGDGGGGGWCRCCCSLNSQKQGGAEISYARNKIPSAGALLEWGFIYLFIYLFWWGGIEMAENKLIQQPPSSLFTHRSPALLPARTWRAVRKSQISASNSYKGSNKGAEESTTQFSFFVIIIYEPKASCVEKGAEFVWK